MAYDTDQQRGAEVPKDFGETFKWPTDGDTLQTFVHAITPHACVRLGSGGIDVAGVGDIGFIGVNRGNASYGPGTQMAGQPVPVGIGRVSAFSDGAITAGQELKCAQLGRVIQFLNSQLTNVTLGSTAGGSFANQPSNAGYQVVSSSAGDTTQTITVYGRRHTTGIIVAEVLTLNGTTPVNSVTTSYDQVLGAVLSAACAGTVTIQTTAPATIITIAPASLTTAGYLAISPAALAYNTTPVAVASGASTKYAAIAGTSPTDVVQYDQVALNGTTPVNFAKNFKTLTALLMGDPTSGTTVTVSTPATADDPLLKIGRALDTTTAAGQLFAIKC